MLLGGQFGRPRDSERPSSKLQILDGGICHTRHKRSHGLKAKTSVLRKILLGHWCPTSSSKCCDQGDRDSARPGPFLRLNG